MYNLLGDVWFARYYHALSGFTYDISGSSSKRLAFSLAQFGRPADD